MSDTLFKQAKLLIVDDEKINIRFLEGILQGAGYTNVFSTTDSHQALALFQEIQPDLLLLDLVMPRRDGLTILRELQANPVTASVPVLVLTADTTLTGKHRALQAGAADFLIKPLDRVEVLLRIHNLLQTRFNRVLLEEKIREAQVFLQSTFDALATHVAVLDEKGIVLAVNRAWQAFFVTSGGIGAACGVGDDYIAECERDAECADALKVAQGIRAVMAGERQNFSLEYACDGGAGNLWFTVSVTRFEGEGRVRVVVAHENVTQRKEAEEQVRKLNALHLRQQRQLTHRIITTLEEERLSISFELHDGLTQYVMSSFAFFDSYAASLGLTPENLPEDLQKGLKYLQEAVIEARRMVNGLRALALDEQGLVPAIEQLLTEDRERANWKEASLNVINPIPRFDTVLETAAYRVVQEALTNIRKHARTKRVEVTLQIAPSLTLGARCLQVEIRDWGRGFEVGEKRKSASHVGLHSMEERANLLRGTILIESQPGEGTRICAEFPIDHRLELC